jgi:hypothetical protein
VAGRLRRQRQPRKLRPADWDKHIEEIQQKRWLDTKPNRLIARRLAAELESEGHAAHRSADYLERLSEFYQVGHVQPFDHAGKTVRGRLHAKGYTKEHLAIAMWLLDRLAEKRLDTPRILRKQAAILLDAAQWTKFRVEQHEDQVARLRRRRDVSKGRPPSLGLRAIVDMMIQLDVSVDDAHEQLAARGIHYVHKSLQVELWRYHRRVPTR